MKVQWKKRTKDGYIKIKVPTRPRVEERILEHVIAAEKKIGRH
jgi:hypothetical protein